MSKPASREKYDVFYEGELVGHFKPDLWIPHTLIIEVKAVRTLSQAHEVQLVNYLTATGIDNGLLINFGSSVEVRRKFSGVQAETHHNEHIELAMHD